MISYMNHNAIMIFIFTTFFYSLLLSGHITSCLMSVLAIEGEKMRSVPQIIAGTFWGACLIIGMPANASETVTYNYDTQGRLTSAVHAGTGTNAGLVTTYQYDTKGNRTTQTVTGSKNNGQQVVVIQLGGQYYLIPINP